MSSGLLSLNVHEPLAFEGTEICLHPDIFQQKSTLSALPGDGLGTRQSSVPNNNGAVSRVSSSRLLGLAHGSSSAAAARDKVQNAAAAICGAHQRERLLQAGDMVMIRVWDPLPPDERVKSTPASSVRNQPLPALFRAQSANMSSNTNVSPSAPARVPLTSVAPLEALQTQTGQKHKDVNTKMAISATRQQNNNPQKDDGEGASVAANASSPTSKDQGTAVFSADSLQTPDMSPQASPANSTSVTELSTAASEAAEKSIAFGFRPPVVPRGRSTGVTSSSVLGSISSKSLTTPGHPGSKQSNKVVTNSESLSRLRMSPISSSVVPKSRHSRDLSDISVDTTFWPGPVGSRRPSTDTTRTAMLGILGGDGDDVLNDIASTHSLRLSLVMLVTEKSLKGLKASSRTHISILRQVADLYHLSTYDTVTVHKLSGEEAEKALQAVSVDFLLVTIKDQFLSRGELHFFQSSLAGSWIYEGQRLHEPSRGIHANAREMRHGGVKVSSGIVTESTKVVYRSRSSRIFWLVQMSAEMWDYASPFQASQKESYCEVYFDRFISFVYDLFEKWKHAEVTHSLTVVFFSRTFLTAAPSSHGNHGPNVQRDIYGRKYEDHCRVVVENETRTDWDALIVRMKQAFFSYPNEVGWNLSSGVGARRPSTAGQGNLLEALNVTLNLLQYHFLDRDLHRTGNSIVVVSAGNGVFEVDKKLALITYQRMMDNGIGSDMLSLGLPPLHVAPFFLYFNEFQEVESEIPHWIHLSFISYESNESLVALNDADKERAIANTPAESKQGAGIEKSEGDSNHRDNNEDEDTPGIVEVEAEVNSQTFSLVRRKTVASSGKANRERHLEDRDIRDILEACRPRATGILPPSLKSLLEMYKAGKTQERTAATQSEQDSGDLNIKEWDGIDLDEVNNRKALLFALDRREQIKPQSSSSPPPMVEVERADSSTQSSSFTNHIPQLLLGTSYERHFLARDHASVIGRTRMQRAISIGSWCGSASDTPYENEEDDLTFLRLMSQNMQQHDRNKMISIVKSPMVVAKQQNAGVDIYDSIHSVPQSQATTFRREQASIGPSALGPVTIHHAAPPGGSQIATGGIGAALSHYSGNSMRESSDTERTGFLSRSFERTRSIPRTSSVGQVPSPLLKRSDVAPRSLSPLVLPPTIPPFAFHGEATYVPNLGPYSNERRFIRAQDLPFGRRDDQLNAAPGSLSTPEMVIHLDRGAGSHRSEPERSSKFSASPSAELKTVSATNHDGSSHYQNASDNISRRKANKSPNPRSTHSPSSDLRRDRTNWQQSGSVGESLSAGNLRRRASPSPNARRRYASPSSETRVIRTRQQSGSADNQLRPAMRRRASPSPVTRSRPRSGSTGQQVGARKRSSSLNPTKVTDLSGGSGTRHTTTTRRRKPINPFRQQDEDEVLAQKSHNSRRWSHVFPQGEIEFKRMSGPNWKSLAAPATLPLSIDYFPPQRERELNFTFSIYNVTLSEFERNNFSSNKELLLEMVRQRITQDYQIVPSYLVDDRDEASRSLVSKDGKDASNDDIRMYLSIGHRLQILHYDPTSDTVEVKTYLAKNAQGNQVGTFKYFYQIYCKETNSYVRMVQDFKQFTAPYNWNKVDRIICGDEDREMREGMRFKRLMFAILPDRFSDVESENGYVEKFKKLLEYFEKLRAKEEAKNPLNVKVVSSQNKQTDEEMRGLAEFLSTPGIAGNSMVRFYVPFRKGGREQFEYLEVAIDSTFNTSWSYRIIFNWLVANAGKVDTQVQLLQRRCNQFGLNLVASSEVSVSKMLFLNPFRAPAIFTIREPESVAILDEKLADLDFIHDGVFLTNRDFIDCIDHGSDFDFGSKWSKLPAGRQVVHRSGVLYMRLIQDRNGKAVVVAIANYKYLQKDDSIHVKYQRVFEQVGECMKTIAD
ncbi:hypothetical protein ACA910_021129 [Epithemia clementina (nom. ined.)]